MMASLDEGRYKMQVYLLGIHFCYGELQIMGIYTDEGKLIEGYEKLMTEDCRCQAEKHPEKPVIYKMPINKFLGADYPWNRVEGKVQFYESEEDIEQVQISEIKAKVIA